MEKSTSVQDEIIGVRQRKATLSMNIGTLGCLTGLGLFCLIGMLFQYEIYFAQNGVDTKAIVTNKSDSAGFDSKPAYILTYTFAVKDKKYSGHEEVSQDVYESTPVGASLQITYLADNPYFSDIQKPRHFLIAWLGMLICLILTVGGAIFLLHAFFIAPVQPEEAEITSLTDILAMTSFMEVLNDDE